MTTPAEPPSPRSPGRVAVGVQAALDRLLLWCLLAFGAWTLLYQLGLAGLVPPAAVVVLWAVAVVVLTVVTWRGIGRLLRAEEPRSPWGALALSAVAAVVAVVTVRPDLDDASYVTRSTWIAEHGVMTDRDTIFSDGHWPALAGQSPYIASVEALFGWISRLTGLSTGTVVYLVFPPLAAALATWAGWHLLRGWRARRPTLSLALALVFLVSGGGVHASMGNVELARIWQGKAFFLAFAVPVLYALASRYWRTDDPSTRRWTVGAIAAAGAVATGLTSTATLVVPVVMVLAAVPGLVRKDWRGSGVVVLAGAVFPVLAGVASIVVRSAVAFSDEGAAVSAAPWPKVVGGGLVAVVALVAVLAPWAGARWPGALGSVDRSAQPAVLAVCGFALLLLLPVVPAIVSGVLGTSAISWRLAWAVPLPLVVGLLASLPARRAALPVAVVAPVAALLLVVGGLPLWSAQNVAWLGAPGSWKVAPEDVRSARWVIEQDPDGLVLGPARVVSALGAITSQYKPVGSRADYMVMLRSQPDGQSTARESLQRIAEGTHDAADLAAAPAYLDELEVGTACVVWPTPEVHALLESSGFRDGRQDGAFYCTSRE